MNKDYNEILLQAIETVVDSKLTQLEQNATKLTIGTVTALSEDKTKMTIQIGTESFEEVNSNNYQVGHQLYIGYTDGESPIRVIHGRVIKDTDSEQNTAFHKTFFEVTSVTPEMPKTSNEIIIKENLPYLWNTIQLEADFQCVAKTAEYALSAIISFEEDDTTKIALDLRSQEMLGNPFGFVMPSRQKAFTQIDSSLLNKKIGSIKFTWKSIVTEGIINPTVTNIKLSFGYYEEDFGNDQVEIDAIGGAGYPIYNEKGEELANTLRARWYNRSDHAKLVWNNGAEGEICEFSPSFMKTEEEVTVKVERVPYQATSDGTVSDKKVIATFNDQKEFEEAEKAFKDKKAIPNVISVKFTNERSSDDAKKDEEGNIKNPLETVVFKHGEDSFEVSISNDYTWDAGATRIFEVLLGSEDKYSVIAYQTDKPLGSASIILKNEKIINDAAKNLGWNVDIVNKDDNTKDAYTQCYDYDNKIIDEHNKWLHRYLCISDSGLPEKWYLGATITWSLPPVKYSMLYPNSFSDIDLESEDGYKVSHYIAQEEDYLTANNVAYRIKEVYNPKLNNNTIICDITLRNKVFVDKDKNELEDLGGGTIRASKSISFENNKVSGTYTLAVYPLRRMCAFTSEDEKSWLFRAELFDKNGNIITNKAKDFTWALKSTGKDDLIINSVETITINKKSDTESKTVILDDSKTITLGKSYRIKSNAKYSNIENLRIGELNIIIPSTSWSIGESKIFNFTENKEGVLDESTIQSITAKIPADTYNVLEVTVDKNVASWGGTPISTIYAMTYCNASLLIHAQAPIYVTYNGAGLLQQESQFGPITAYRGNNVNESCYWILRNAAKGGPIALNRGAWNDDWNGFENCYVVPTVADNGVSLNIPQDYSYPDNYKPYLMIYKEGTGIVWSAPIIIRQNKYGSEILNNWDGKTEVQDGYILSAAAAFGKKNSQNQYSGVILGEVGKITGETKTIKTGLLGYHEGIQTFGFNTDGSFKIESYKRTDGNPNSYIRFNNDGDLEMKINSAKIILGDQENENLQGYIDASVNGISASISETYLTKEGSADKAFGWSLTSQGFYIGNTDKPNSQNSVLAVNSKGLVITGTIHATGGRIGADSNGNGGWVISSNEIKGKLGNYEALITTAGLGDSGDVVFGVTDSNNNYTAWISGTGVLHASGAQISGTITSSSISSTTINNGNGTFKVEADGTLQATKAKISGDIIGGTINIGNKFIVDKNGYTYINGGGLTIGAQAAGTYTNISSNGILTCYGADVKGTITAEKGAIGNWTIDTGLKYNQAKTFQVFVTGSPYAYNIVTNFVHITPEGITCTRQINKVVAQHQGAGDYSNEDELKEAYGISSFNTSTTSTTPWGRLSKF